MSFDRVFGRGRASHRSPPTADDLATTQEWRDQRDRDSGRVQRLVVALGGERHCLRSINELAAVQGLYVQTHLAQNYSQARPDVEILDYQLVELVNAKAAGAACHRVIGSVYCHSGRTNLCWAGAVVVAHT